MLPRMAKSSITKPAEIRSRPVAGTAEARSGRSPARSGQALREPNSEFARNLGSLIRARRRDLGMTQTELGWPLTKGFVSEVERGRSLPSLGALILMAQRLGVPISYLLGEVNGGLSPVYTPLDDNDHATSNSGHRR